MKTKVSKQFPTESRRHPNIPYKKPKFCTGQLLILVLLHLSYISRAESQTRSFVDFPGSNSIDWRSAAQSQGLEVCKLVFQVGWLNHGQTIRVVDPANCDCWADVTYISDNTALVSSARVEMMSGFPAGTENVYPRHSGEGRSTAITAKLVLLPFRVPQNLVLTFGNQQVYGFGVMTGDVYNPQHSSPVAIMGMTSSYTTRFFTYMSVPYNFQLNYRYFMGALDPYAPLRFAQTRFFGQYSSDGVWIESLYIARARTGVSTGNCPAPAPTAPRPKSPSSGSGGADSGGGAIAQSPED